MDKTFDTGLSRLAKSVRERVVAKERLLEDEPEEVPDMIKRQKCWHDRGTCTDPHAALWRPMPVYRIASKRFLVNIDAATRQMTWELPGISHFGPDSRYQAWGGFEVVAPPGLGHGLRKRAGLRVLGGTGQAQAEHEPLSRR